MLQSAYETSGQDQDEDRAAVDERGCRHDRSAEQALQKLHLREIASALVRLEAFTRIQGFEDLASRIDAAVDEADRMLTAR
ncbi:hypothetical protein [Parvularcula oceani]|uniref:hypothetical protein n=1 Tax=Parvularcula oceani TaxID=1247963 RepID=UPI0004E22FBD|nr:hypothetical protein [Parvularcula oceani]